MVASEETLIGARQLGLNIVTVLICTGEIAVGEDDQQVFLANNEKEKANERKS